MVFHHSLAFARAVLVHFVVLGHVFRFFEINSFGLELFDKHQGLSPTVNLLLLLGHQSVLPALFFIAGCSGMFGMSRAQTWTSFVGKRARQLLVPAILAYFLFVLPKQYVFVDSCQAVELPSLLPNPMKWISLYFTHCFASKGFEWLWFALLLFLANVLLYPLLSLWHEQTARELPKLSTCCMVLIMTAGLPILVVSSDLDAFLWLLASSAGLYLAGAASVAFQLDQVLGFPHFTLRWWLVLLSLLSGLVCCLPSWDHFQTEPEYMLAEGVFPTYRDGQHRLRFELGKYIWASLVYLAACRAEGPEWRSRGNASVFIVRSNPRKGWQKGSLVQSLIVTSPLVFMAHPLPLFVLAREILAQFGKQNRFGINMVLLILTEYGCLWVICASMVRIPFLDRVFLSQRSLGEYSLSNSGSGDDSTAGFAKPKVK